MSIIEVQNVVKEYQIIERKEGLKDAFKSLIIPHKKIIKAVNNISFKVEEGDIVGFVGPNGAGKSTIVKMMTGILLPSSGKILIKGIEPYKKRKQNARNIGVVFGQRTQLWWDIPVIETFALLKEMYKVNEADYKKRLDMFTDILDLGEILKKPVRQLSLGQRMRSDLAAAFLHNPEILFLDEPTIGLDVVVKDKIRSFLNEINKSEGTVIFLTTHDMEDIQRLSNKIMLIDKGEMIYNGRIEQFREKYDLYEKISINIADNEKGELELILKKYNQQPVFDENTAIITCQKELNNSKEILSEIVKLKSVDNIMINETQLEDIIKNIYKK